MKAFEWVSTIFNIFSVSIDNERGKILNIGFHIRFQFIVHFMLYDYQSFVVSLWDITVYLHLGIIQKYNIYRKNYCTFMVFIIKNRNSNTIFKVSSKTLRVKTFDSSRGMEKRICKRIFTVPNCTSSLNVLYSFPLPSFKFASIKHSSRKRADFMSVRWFTLH